MLREGFEEPVNTAWRRLPEHNLQQTIIIDTRASATVGVVGQQVQRPVRTLKDVVVVSDAAVQRGPNGLYAYVVTPGSKAELRDIQVGQIEGGLALVEKGLSPGERIVTAGHYRVLPGGPVQVLDDQERRTAVTPSAQKVD